MNDDERAAPGPGTRSPVPYLLGALKEARNAHRDQAVYFGMLTVIVGWSAVADGATGWPLARSCLVVAMGVVMTWKRVKRVKELDGDISKVCEWIVRQTVAKNLGDGGR